MNKKVFLPVLFVLMLILLCSCQKPEIEVTVQDERNETQLTVKEGTKVEDILSQAAITLGEKDVVEPELNAKIIEAGSTVTIGRYAKVNLVYNGETKTYELCGKKVSDLMTAAGLDGEEHLGVNYDKDTYLSEIKDDIVVSELEKVTIICDGKESEVYTSAESVDDLLKEQGIKLGKLDRVSHGGDKVIIIERVTTKDITETETVSFSTEKKYSSDMMSGKSKVTKQGVNGKKECVYRVTYVDGKEESREKLSEKVITPAENQIITYGTKQAAATTQSSAKTSSSGKTVVSREKQPDCDDSGHGYYIVKYSDGSTEYIDY